MDVGEEIAQAEKIRDLEVEDALSLYRTALDHWNQAQSKYQKAVLEAYDKYAETLTRLYDETLAGGQ